MNYKQAVAPPKEEQDNPQQEQNTLLVVHSQWLRDPMTVNRIEVLRQNMNEAKEQAKRASYAGDEKTCTRKVLVACVFQDAIKLLSNI